jgi:Arc/MetJ-type ribon-helix-helix transcriptional regulator
MPATEQITLTLSSDLVEKLRSRSASDGYANESEFLQDHLTEALEPDSELEHWLKTIGVARYDAYDANPNDVYTSDEVLENVQARLAARQKAA